MHIPKILMQTWKSKDIPEKWRKGQESIKKNLIPNGWQHVLLTDEDCLRFVKENFPQYFDVFQNLKYNIQRADMIRYCWLYKYGGIYMDMDYAVEKDIEPLFSDAKADIYLTYSPNMPGLLTNSFMASVPGSDFWLRCLERIASFKNPFYYTKHFYVMHSTGPYIVENTFQAWERVNVTLIPYKLIGPCTLCNPNCGESSSYLSVLPGGSWNGIDSIIMDFAFCNPGTSIFLFLFLLILLIGVLWCMFKSKLCRSECNSSKICLPK
jgi:mannosyltransferase OCH1-like enzyme